MALTQENIDLIAQTVRTADSDATRSVQGTDVTPLIDGSTIWATDRRTPFRWAPTDTNAAVAYQIVKPDSGLAGSWLLAGGSGTGTVDVWSIADLPAPVAGVITLAATTTYVVHGNISIGTNRIALSSGSEIDGIGGAEISGTNAAGLVSGTGVAADLRNVCIVNLGNGPALAWGGGGLGNQLRMYDCVLLGTMSAAYLSGAAGDYINIRDCIFYYTTVGANFIGAWDSVTMNDCRFLGSGDGILVSSAAGEVALMLVNGCEFQVPTGTDIGIEQTNADAVTIGRIVGCMFDTAGGTGTAVGVLVATTEWVALGNAGLADF